MLNPGKSVSVCRQCSVDVVRRESCHDLTLVILQEVEYGFDLPYPTSVYDNDSSETLINCVRNEWITDNDLNEPLLLVLLVEEPVLAQL